MPFPQPIPVYRPIDTLSHLRVLYGKKIVL